MGTSSAYGGPKGSTPLVPSWLDPDGADTPGAPEPADGQAPTDGPPPGSAPPAPPPRLLPPVAPDIGRFTAARNRFSRFARSGGSDLASLGRAVSQYGFRSCGGPSRAAQRMGSARISGARLFGFLSDAQARGLQEALRALDLEGLAGRRIEEIFLGLADYICPDGGTVDEGIARDAFIETIADLANLGITDLDALTHDQVQTVFELYATHAIEARILNDIGKNVVVLSTDIRAAERVQAQLRDFVRRGVSDALHASRTALQQLTPDRVLGFVGGVYEAAFGILQAFGEAEGAA
jgi:hypothetical protein